MRYRRLLSQFVAVLLVSACAIHQSPPSQCPAPCAGMPTDAGTVSLEASGDGITLLLYGVLSRERFILDYVKPVGSRLSSRSPDPDMFRVVTYDLTGEVLGTMSLWSPLDNFERDSEGQRHHRMSAVQAEVVIPVAAQIGVSAVELQWPGGTGLGRIDVRAVLRRFCAHSPRNPGCRL